MHQTPSFIHQLTGHVIIPYELLEAQAMQDATAEPEHRRKTQQHNGNREVDVETIRDELDHVHVAHDLITG